MTPRRDPPYSEKAAFQVPTLIGMSSLVPPSGIGDSCQHPSVQRETDTETDTETETETETERWRDGETEKQRDRETERQTDRQIERQGDKQTDRQTDRQIHMATVITLILRANRANQIRQWQATTL